MEVCKVCKKEKIKSLDAHLKFCLKKYDMTREEYDVLPDDYEDMSEEVLNMDTIKVQEEVPKTREENIFDNVKKRDPERPLKEALKEYNITEQEFHSVMKFWKGQGAIPLDRRMKNKKTKGLAEAEKLSSNQNVETSNVDTAEVLVSKYGFKCLKVQAQQDNKPKIWVLTKE
jgi:hypothetical protein